MSTEQLTEKKIDTNLEQNRSTTYKVLASLLNLSTLNYPPLRNWRTGDVAEDKLRSTRIKACAMILAVTIPAIIAVCLWLW